MARTDGGPRVALISLEPWDQVWRRNQHLVRELTEQGLVDSVVFVEPPVVGQSSTTSTPIPNVTVLRPPLPLPRRLGGLSISARWLRRHVLTDVTTLWINDPVLGVRCLSPTCPAVYDVTDDWRQAHNPPRITARYVAAEDRLAREATTIVCSAELARRWHDRYSVQATVVNNAATAATYADVGPLIELTGDRPHVGYVGTLHEERLDIDLCVGLADSAAVGTLHLLGPDALSAQARQQLDRAPNLRRHPAVDSTEVPRWLMSFDALLSPHVISNFTKSLDAIKAFEYLATDRPVVATPTSGFQDLTAPGLVVADTDRFIAATDAALGSPARFTRSMPTWAQRAQEFAGAADLAMTR